MKQISCLTTQFVIVLGMAFLGYSSNSDAADSAELIYIRTQIQQLKDLYETRIQVLEQRVQEAEAKSDQGLIVQDSTSVPQPVASSANAANTFNPKIALILGGTNAYLSQDPNQYRLQGFLPSGDEVGPGKRGLNLGESELTLSANVDHRSSGQLTFSLASDNAVSVEESFFQTQGLSQGINLKAGRFLSSAGYLNSQHAHVWDFVDAPLVYQAWFGGSYKTDGVQLSWLAPTDRFFEMGLELGRGDGFPGNDRNKNNVGSTALFAHVGDDIGTAASWRSGVSYVRTRAEDRGYDEVDSHAVSVTNAFSGTSDIWIADGIFKWAPNGNPVDHNFKLQGEYFWRNDKGTLTYDTQGASLGTASGDYRAAQSGWYVQGVYQFSPHWRAGLRYDQLYSGTSEIGLVTDRSHVVNDFERLISYNPSRSSFMVDYSVSEFSRFRAQWARDQSRPDVIDHQIFLQYIMSLGAHGAHSF